MSTANNSEQLFDNSVKILTDLIGFKTISGEDNSNLSLIHISEPTRPY